MKRQGMVSVLVCCLILLCQAWPVLAQKRKILYVDSYHPGYLWSAEITRGIQNILSQRSDIDLKIFRMDTKRNQSETHKKKAALTAKTLIESWRPEVVITSDDNAARYLILPYYRGSELPFVFCGLNWDASVYGFPAKNVTGMIEVALFEPAMTTLEPFVKGDRIGFLGSDTATERKNLGNLTRRFHVRFKARLAKTFEQLCQDFLDLQKECDLILIRECRSVKGFNHIKMQNFIRANTRVPTLAMENHLVAYALITYAKIGEEQGEYAAGTALEILDGRSPVDIPVTANKKSKIYLNMSLANRLGIKFPVELMEYAELLSIEPKKLLYINSYHKGYRWSDDIEMGLFKALDIKINPDQTLDTSQSQVDIKILRMDTKLHPEEGFKKQAALKAKALIDQWKPDIVVASDDNASKYLIAPYFINKALPFVFCGVNLDASVYGFPAANITGMVEVGPVRETLDLLKSFARGNRTGIIGADNISNRRWADRLKIIAAIPEKNIHLVHEYPEWEKKYLDLQSSLDILIWLGHPGIRGWDAKQAYDFVLKNTRIVSGGFNNNNVSFTLLGRASIAEEQGWWAGKTALKILSGTDPAAIPVTTNKESQLFLNMELAQRLGIKFPMALMEEAVFLEPRKTMGVSE